jgi:hypothetical protein
MFGSSARASVIRTAVFYTPLFVASAIGALAILSGIWNGGIVLLIILLILSFLFGYQSIQSLRDMRKEMTTTRGPILRIWSKRDVFVSKSYYITVNRNIYKIPLTSYFDLREEAKRMRDAELDDYRIEVEIVHYPHTGTVESVERLGQVRVSQDGRPITADQPDRSSRASE